MPICGVSRGRGDGGAAEVDVAQPVLQRAIHPARAAVHEEGTARDGRRHAPPRHSIRSQQSVGTLPARPVAPADRAGSRTPSASSRSPNASRASRAADMSSRCARCRRVRAPCCASSWCPAHSRTRRRRLRPSPLPTSPASAGLRDPAVYGGIDRKRFIIETNGSGVALVDYDHDGWLDALTLSGTRLQDGTRADGTRRPRHPTGCTGTSTTALSRT